MMIWGRIMLQFLFVITPWESLALTKKRRSADYTGGVRSFRHISGSSSSLADWEVGLREAVLQALLRERYQDPNLRERLVTAPLIGRQDTASPFGDVAVLARGQVYGIHSGNFAFVQDPYQNDCDDCHSPRRCTRHQCQPWTPHNQEQLIALWTVKRLRHRDFNNIHRYEIEYTISPINSETREIVTRRGRFNYAIPGHVFVIKSHDNSMNLPTVISPEVYNRKIPHKHFKPDILIGVDTAGYKHVLHSYPGFYTHPVHPSNNQGINNLKENDLYNKLLDTLAAKTSTTTQREVSHQIYMNHYGGATKPDYVANTPPVSSSPLITMTHPVFNNIPTKPTMLHRTTIRVQQNTRPLLTTVHYFMPDGEEQLLTSEVNFKDMNELTTEREEEIPKEPSTKPNQNIAPPKPTKVYYEQSNKPPTSDDSTVDQLTKMEMTTGPSKPTKKYYKTKITKPKTTKYTTPKTTKYTTPKTTKYTTPKTTKYTTPRTTKYTTPKTTYIKPQMTSNEKTSTTKPKSTTHISTSTKVFSTSKSSPITTSKSTSSSTQMTSSSTSTATTPITTISKSPTKAKVSTTTSSPGTTKKITNTTKVVPAASQRTSTTLKTTSTTPISTYSSKQTPPTTTILKSSTTPKVSTTTSTSSPTKEITNKTKVIPAASQSKSTTLKTTSNTPISTDPSKQTSETSPTTAIMKSSKKPKVSTTTNTSGTTKKITYYTTKVMPAASQITSTNLKTTSTAPISTDSSKQTHKKSPSTTKNKTASKSTVPSISSTLLHTTPQIIETTASSTTSTSTILSQIMSKIPPSIYVTTISPTIETSNFPTPTNFTQYDITSKTSPPTITEITKPPSTTVASSTLEVTTALPITNQEIEEPENFPKPTKPMEVIPLIPSDEPEPSNQMSAPGEESETTPYSNTLMTTTKRSDESVSTRDELEKTTQTTLLESTIGKFMMELDKPVNTAIAESTKIMNIMEATMTTGEFHQSTERTAAEISTTPMTVQSDKSTESIPNTERSNRTETTESLPEIETTIEIEDIKTSTQATEDNKLTTSVQANTDKLTQNISNIEITTQKSTTRVTTKQTSKTTKKQTASSKKPTSVPNDFLIDVEPVKAPIHTKPANQEYNLDDIFGPTIATRKLTLTAATEPIESDLAQQLFGEKMTRNYEVIYSNFYEPSTAPTVMKYDETTMKFQPLTQSYDTSISYKVNRPSDTSDETTMNFQPLTGSYDTSISYKVNRPSDTSDETTMNFQPLTGSYDTSISYKVNRPSDTSDETTMNFQPLTGSYDTSISYKVNRPSDTSDETTMNFQPLTGSYDTSISYKVNRPSDTSDETTMNFQPLTGSYDTSISYKVNRPSDTSDETTMNFLPPTSQSYETSISYKVNRQSDKSASSDSSDIENIPVSENIEDSHKEDLPNDEYANTTAESGITKRNFSTKKDFDKVAMQLVNHARIIDYGSKTSKAKYKRRRTHKPKTRQSTRKRKKLETKKNL